MTKIGNLKKLFNKHKIDGYLIPKNDEFFNEYVSEEKDNLNFISNFSGSYGFALILKKKNYLFVDGRYSLQAKMQSGRVFKILTIPNQYPYSILKSKKLRIGFYSRVFTENTIKNFFQKTKCDLIPLNIDLVNQIKKKKIKIKIKKFYKLLDKDSGLSAKFKINRLSNFLSKNKVDLQLITSSENVAWLTNLRGNDSNYSPLPNSYLIIDKFKRIFLFCNLAKVDSKLKRSLRYIKFLDIKFIENFLINLTGKKILIDKNTCSIFFKIMLNKNNKLIEKNDPIYYFKSKKNKTEIQNSIKSHIHDGVALTKFIFWLKDNYKKKKICEIKAQNKLFNFRKKSKFFKGPSFPTISGTRSNGSIIHYRASKKTNKLLKDGDIYLVDSGGQYNFGTTDVTRTLSLDNSSSKIKKIYTSVLKGHIAVTNFTLKSNTIGSNIDDAARAPLKRINLDYPHGTGHGVGYFLNVHEGPIAFSKKNKVNLSEGMIISNEPGYYENGKFGIRIENLIYVKKRKNKIYFKNLTMAPLEKSLIDRDMLNIKEKLWINNYHNEVYNNLKKFMNSKELLKLKSHCSNI